MAEEIPSNHVSQNLVRHQLPVKPLTHDPHLVEILAAHRKDVHRVRLNIQQFPAEQQDFLDPVGRQVAQVMKMAIEKGPRGSSQNFPEQKLIHTVGEATKSHVA